MNFSINSHGRGLGRFDSWLDTYLDEMFNPAKVSKSGQWKVTKVKDDGFTWYLTEDKTSAKLTLDIPGVGVGGVMVHMTGNVVDVSAKEGSREYSFSVPLCRDALPATLVAEVLNGVLTLCVTMKTKDTPSEQRTVEIKVSPGG